MKDTYNCFNCGEEWNFIPEDYEDISGHSTVCPLCSMPVTQMIKDCYEAGGIKEVIGMLWKRFI